VLEQAESAATLSTNARPGCWPAGRPRCSSTGSPPWPA